MDTTAFSYLLSVYRLIAGQNNGATKVRLVKAMVFPLVMYGCESWTVKKAERRRIDAFERGIGEDS